MAAPTKKDEDKIVQVKVHVKKSDLAVYDRKLIEALISQHKNGEFHVVEVKVPKFKNLPSQGFEGYSEAERKMAAAVISKYRQTKNVIAFGNQVFRLK